MRLIVNADDLGISETVNDAIFDLIGRGLVTSASIIANGPALEGLAARCAAFPKASFGVHLNLTQFKPVTASSGLTPLLDENGNFRGPAIRNVALRPRLLAAIYSEWKAQITKLRALGICVSHIDSHHHVHTIPRLFPVLKLLQMRAGIRKVRTTKNIYADPSAVSGRLLTQKRLWHWLLCRLWQSKIAQGFTSLDDFRAVAERHVLGQWLQGDFGNASVEVMVHPGNAHYAAETEKLSHDWIGRMGFQLISYADI